MPYLVVDKEGKIVGTVDTVDEAAAVILGSPVQYLSFYAGGTQKDVDSFMGKLNEGDNSFFKTLTEAEGHRPISINPLQAFRDQFMRSNTTFVKIKGNTLHSTVAAQLLNVLKNTLSAGSRIFIIIEKSTSEDVYSLADSVEEVTVFYQADVDDGYSNARDLVLAESIV